MNENGVMRYDQLIKFVQESWDIEGEWLSEQHAHEIVNLHMQLINEGSSLDLLVMLAAQFTDGKGELRNQPGMDVQVGSYVAPKGGPEIVERLQDLIEDAHDQLHPYDLYVQFEKLHPFIDGNGRVGRALWLWRMRGNAPLGFLRHWHYQSLAMSDGS